MGNVGGKSGLSVDNPLDKPAEVVETGITSTRDVILGAEAGITSVITTGEQEVGQTVRVGIQETSAVIQEAERDVTRIVSETEANLLHLVLDTEQNITQTVDLVIIGGVIIAGLVIYTVGDFAKQNPSVVNRAIDKIPAS